MRIGKPKKNKAKGSANPQNSLLLAVPRNDRGFLKMQVLIAVKGFM